MTTKTNRRRLLAGMASLFGLSFLYRQSAAAGDLTPQTSAGPYYPPAVMRKPDVNNDLVKVLGQVEASGGDVFMLRGQVAYPDGTPRMGHRVEIWQVDMNANYMHTRDPRSENFDPAFQGFGHDITDANGSYVFRTITPAEYPGRTPRIHVKVFDPDGRDILTTQFYVRDHPSNARDSLYNRMSDREAECVTMGFENGPDGRTSVVDIVV